MRRAERLHAITNHLRARAPRLVSAAQLSERFGVSQRTIERDLRSLNDAGVPIFGIPGRNGGFSVLPDHAMPPLQLTVQEATACVLAFSMLDRSPFSPDARTALDKIRLALPPPIAQAVDADATSAAVVTVAGRGAITSARWLDAVREHLLVNITYGDDPKPRLVEPYTTLEGAGSWYLVGWCHRRQDVRGFRTDRITALRATDTHFAPIHASEIAADLSRWSTRPLP